MYFPSETICRGAAVGHRRMLRGWRPAFCTPTTTDKSKTRQEICRFAGGVSGSVQGVHASAVHELPSGRRSAAAGGRQPRAHAKRAARADRPRASMRCSAPIAIRTQTWRARTCRRAIRNVATDHARHADGVRRPHAASTGAAIEGSETKRRSHAEADSGARRPTTTLVRLGLGPRRRPHASRHLIARRVRQENARVDRWRRGGAGIILASFGDRDMESAPATANNGESQVGR